MRRIGLWERLVSTLPAEDPSREAIQGGIARAREQLGKPASAEVTKPAGEMITRNGAELTVEVQLAVEMADKVSPTDAVFVFARPCRWL